MSDENVVHAFRIADAEALIQHVFIRDLTLKALIGVYSHNMLLIGFYMFLTGFDMF